MIDKLDQVEKRYEELTSLLGQPEVATDLARVQSLARERAGLEKLVEKYREYKATIKSLGETEAMLGDGLEPDMVALVKQEIEKLRSRQEELQGELRLALVPKDPRDEKGVIVEIRAGTGGDEAGLFAADLYRMYSRYAQSKGWEVEVIDSSDGALGGFKEIIFEVKGKGAFSRLKYESGVHRVQRVPATEASGRIHTSTATVVVLPAVEETELHIAPDDLKVEFFRARGAGGQNVNKLSTAVRITHLPTGITASCQDERSQIRNRMKAMVVLRARLLDKEQSKQQEELTQERRSQVGTGDRAEKIRTYNFPQDRLTDHRLDLSVHNLPRILQGEIDGLIDALASNEQAASERAAQVV